jgi:archaellum biogenesis ATPase FlaH
MNPLKMFKSKIDIKTIFILVLGAAVILLLLFRPSKGINTHEEEILILKTQNKVLIQNNDSLSSINNKLIEDVVILEEGVEEINIKLEDSTKEIEKLKKKKNEISSNVIIMDANDVTNNIADYLERRN